MSTRDPAWLRDLCAEARAGRLDPVVSREDLLGRALRVLARRGKRNLVLTGRPGVGKSAMAEGIAQLLAEGGGPPSLAGAAVLSLDLGCMLGGTSYRGEFEGRVSALLKRLRAPAIPPILFIDEVHLLLRAGRSEGGIDAANLLKPALARGEFVCLGASTSAEWEAIATQDPALARRFSVLEVPEPDRALVLCILEALRPALERHHGLRISVEALAAAADLPADPRCPTFMPDRAIDRLDEACAALQLSCMPSSRPPRRGQRAFDLRARALALEQREAVAEEVGTIMPEAFPLPEREADGPPWLLARHVCEAAEWGRVPASRVGAGMLSA